MASDDAMADVWYIIGQVGRTTPARRQPLRRVQLRAARAIATMHGPRL